jgi:hypothetical protein
MSDNDVFDGMDEEGAKKCAFCLVLLFTALVAFLIKPTQDIKTVRFIDYLFMHWSILTRHRTCQDYGTAGQWRVVHKRASATNFSTS